MKLSLRVRAALLKLDGLLEKAVRLIEAATVDDMARGFEDDLGDLIQSLLRGGKRLSKADFRRDMKKMIKDWAKQMFGVAWEAGGGDVDKAEAEDLALLEDFTSEQQGFVSDFADWLTDKDSDLDAVPDRVALWGASLENFGSRVKARAMGNPRLTLKLRPGAKRSKEPCDTCSELEGETHTLAWWQGGNPDGEDYTKRNGNDAYICGHWDDACNHSFYHAKTGDLVIA